MTKSNCYLAPIPMPAWKPSLQRYTVEPQSVMRLKYTKQAGRQGAVLLRPLMALPSEWRSSYGLYQ